MYDSRDTTSKGYIHTMRSHTEANGHILVDRISPKSEINSVETMNGLVTLSKKRGILPLNGEHLVVEENTDLGSKEDAQNVEMDGSVLKENEISPSNCEQLHVVDERCTYSRSEKDNVNVEKVDVAVLKENGISPSNGKQLQIVNEMCTNLRSEKDSENVDKVDVAVLKVNGSPSNGKQQHGVEEKCKDLRSEKDAEDVEKMDVAVLKEANNNVPMIIVEEVCVEESACISKKDIVAKTTQHTCISVNQRPETISDDLGLLKTKEENEAAGDSDVDEPDNDDQSDQTRFHLDAELASAMFQKFLDKRQEAAVYIPCDEADGQIFLSPIVAEKKVKEVSPDGRIDPEGHIRRVSVSQHGRTPDTQVDASDNIRHDDSIGERESLKVETEKRTEATLKINGNVDFCKIETARYKCTGSLLEDEGAGQKSTGKKRVIKQHYIEEMMKDQVSGETLLKPLDELLEVNSHKLTNKRQKYVLKTFKDIKLERENDHLQLKLDIKVRRWLKAENKDEGPASSDDDDDDDEWAKVLEIDISLVLVPAEEVQQVRNSGRWTAVKQAIKRKRNHQLRQDLTVRRCREDVTEEKALPRGNLHVFKVDPAYEARIKICDGNQRYIRCTSDGLLASGVINQQSSDMVTFTLEPFTARDLGPSPVSMYAFGCRICCERDGGSWYMRYGHGDAGHDLFHDHGGDYDLHCQLHMKDEISSNNIDSRCFIKRQNGNKILLQSAIERDRFVYFDGKDFTMNEIDTDILERLMNQDPSTLKYFDGCWFAPWRQEQKDRSVLSFLSCGIYRSKRRSRGQYSSRNARLSRNSRQT